MSNRFSYTLTAKARNETLGADKTAQSPRADSLAYGRIIPGRLRCAASGYVRYADRIGASVASRGHAG